MSKIALRKEAIAGFKFIANITDEQLLEYLRNERTDLFDHLNLKCDTCENYLKFFKGVYTCPVCEYSVYIHQEES